MVPLQLDPDALRCVETALAGAGLSFMSLGRKWQGLSAIRSRDFRPRLRGAIALVQLRHPVPQRPQDGSQQAGQRRSIGRHGVEAEGPFARTACMHTRDPRFVSNPHPHLLCLTTENPPGTVGRVQRQHLHAMAAEHARAEAGRTEASAGRGAAGTLAGLRGRVRPGGVPCVGTLQ